ncbi:hypothetical protein [Nocardia sp. NBC_00403]|uniref:hypothetical protein n=1 Tax=Nocardia sp. NBC_00403 TaxID=2975990 RepID=UPI002E1C13E1
MAENMTARFRAWRRRTFLRRDPFSNYGNSLLFLAAMSGRSVAMGRDGSRTGMQLDGRVRIVFDPDADRIDVLDGDDPAPVQNWASLPPSFDALADLVAARLGIATARPQPDGGAQR